MSPADVVTAARGLIGTPYHHQARVPGVGIDCAGVLIVVARQLGLVAPDFDVTGYPRVPDGVALRDYCEAHMVRVQTPVLGGAVLASWKDGPPQHLGIVADYQHGGLSFIHADGERVKAVIETRLAFSRYFRLVAAYGFPGVDYEGAR